MLKSTSRLVVIALRLFSFPGAVRSRRACPTSACAPPTSTEACRTTSVTCQFKSTSRAQVCHKSNGNDSTIGLCNTSDWKHASCFDLQTATRMCLCKSTSRGHSLRPTLQQRGRKARYATLTHLLTNPKLAPNDRRKKCSRIIFSH